MAFLCSEMQGRHSILSSGLWTCPALQKETNDLTMTCRTTGTPHQRDLRIDRNTDSLHVHRRTQYIYIYMYVRAYTVLVHGYMSTYKQIEIHVQRVNASPTLGRHIDVLMNIHV